MDHQPPLPLSKPALSGHSTSNPSMSSEHPRFHSPTVPAVVYSAAAVDPRPLEVAHQAVDEEEDEEEAGSDSEAETGLAASRRAVRQGLQGVVAAAEQSELMQLEMSEDIRLGSPEDGSNNLDSDLHMLTVNQNQAGNVNTADHQRRVDAFRAESCRRWQLLQDPLGSLPEGPPSGINHFLFLEVRSYLSILKLVQ